MWAPRGQERFVGFVSELASVRAELMAREERCVQQGQVGGPADRLFARVDELLEEETRRYRPTKNYLEHLPPLDLASFETDLIRTEFERLSNRQAMDTLSMKR